MDEYIKDFDLALEHKLKAPSHMWDLGDESPEVFWDSSDDLLIEKRNKIRTESLPPTKPDPETT